MENIGYIYAACAYEAPESIEVVPFIFNKKQSTFAAMRLLSVALSLFLLSNIGQALALEKQGSKGASVTAIQSCLKQLGYFNASATGYYGSLTKSAVSKFQKDNGLAIDGIVGSDTKKNIQAKCSSQQATTNQANVLKVGSRGQDVKKLQQDLKQLNYFVGNPTDYFGPVTKDAVIGFQRSKGLTIDGIAGSTTLVAIKQSLAQGSNSGVGGENVTLRLGSRGAEVTSLQERLQQLNYFKGNTNGYYGAITRDAVIRFQKDKRLTADGIAGAKTQQAIDQAIQQIKPVPDKILPLPYGSCSDGKCPNLKPGDKNRYVTYLQTRLRDWGYFTSNANGNYSSETAEAVKRFQQDNQLIADGVVGPQTWQRIEIPRNSRNKCDRPILQRGDKGECVTELQDKLRGLGYFKGSSTAYFGNDTWEAVKQFQLNNELTPNGIVDSRTWKAIESTKVSANSYVVLVPVTSPYTLNEVRRFVSSAFITNTKLGTFVQVGEFKDSNGANQSSQNLRDRGFDARVERKDRL
ncbi:peptidoglycan-binding protein [Rivularia sp. UHCC 0363]|uniref:peptidoglycan-binding domain-containing protein n=1 Tax=Rivularia sp. UHCC 0363 TaxID=3110244 RepID=UPI002B218972|nr:peptidoglycan-binding protein [Rivularia sp. UHCC 0363]MEA5592978.1 peptidoglycan-binding protein [Rivularia sp. UHCC 0363]